MAKSKVTPLGEVIVELISAYEIAKDSEYVMKPLSYALYQTWRKWDKTEKPRNAKGDNDGT